MTVDSSARDSLFSITHSLLKVIGSYTGCYVTLVAAAVPSKSGNQDYFSAYVSLSSRAKILTNASTKCALCP